MIMTIRMILPVNGKTNLMMECDALAINVEEEHRLASKNAEVKYKA